MPSAIKLERADPARIKSLQADLEAAIEKANSYVVDNLYPRIIEENGGVGMNADTAEDDTEFFYSFPANRVELWFYLESARFLHPVYRQFYKERSVVREERRMRTESDPQGKLVEQMLATAIEAHPYRIPASGLGQRHREPAGGRRREFFKKYYVPANLTDCHRGGRESGEGEESLATEYFGRLPKGPLPPPVTTVEPEQVGPKRVEVESPAQPMEIIAYHRPDQYDKDDPVLDVVSSVLSEGRTSIIYRDMVRDKRLALAAGAEAPFPGGKYPGLFFFYLIPGDGPHGGGKPKGTGCGAGEF